MTKKYQYVTEKVRTPGGELFDAIKMAIVEFTCLGERRFDLAGYPHSTEMHALAEDWERLGQDALQATKKFRHSLEPTIRTLNTREIAAQIIRLRAELADLEAKAQAAQRETFGETEDGERTERPSAAANSSKSTAEPRRAFGGP